MCWHREDNAAPTFAWTLSTMPVGTTTVRFHHPAGARGLVVLFDGGGGGSVWFTFMEDRLLVEALVDAGLAVAAVQSEGPSGSYDMTEVLEDNLDLQNVSTTIADLGFAGGDVYYLGFSSGGVFASLAATVIPAKALALLSARGLEATFSSTAPLPPPTMWVLGRNDRRVPPTDPGLITNWAAIAASGVDWAYYVNEPVGMLPEAFERIADPTSGVSPTDSADAVAQLAAGGQLDACSVPLGRGNAIDWTVVTPGPSFTGPFLTEARRQVDELFGAHTVTSDVRQQIADFFLAHP